LKTSEMVRFVQAMFAGEQLRKRHPTRHSSHVPRPRFFQGGRGFGSRFFVQSEQGVRRLRLGGGILSRSQLLGCYVVVARESTSAATNCCLLIFRVLKMPEEQAFCVLVKLMYNYRLRDLYKDGFDNLYLRLHQLNCLMEEHLSQLWQHFKDHHVETHMFASQWFLTLFTARFPLYFVFQIIDVFLLQGFDTLFQVALALLMVSPGGPRRR
jgi:hypothetical protein